MLDEATLGLMIMAFGWIVYHCKEWKKERVQFRNFLEVRSDSFSSLAGDAMEALEDIVDGVQNVGDAGPGPAVAGGLPELFLRMMVDRQSATGDVHASTQETERPVLLTESDQTSEQIQESD